MIIRHLDGLAAEAAAGLAAVLDAAPAAARVVATTAETPPAHGGAAQALVDRFGQMAQVPGLATAPRSCRRS